MPASLILYHATDEALLDRIRTEGLRTHSYWTSNTDLADYYRECLEDEGKSAALLAIEVQLPLTAPWAPDYPGIEEPISTVIGLSEDEVIEQWNALPKSEETAQACLDLIGSVRCEALIPPTGVFIVDLSDPEEDRLVPLIATPSVTRKRRTAP